MCSVFIFDKRFIWSPHGCDNHSTFIWQVSCLLLPRQLAYTLIPPAQGYKATAMARYYTLAKGEEITSYSSGYPWPYEVSICFDQVPFPVVIAEGVAHGAASTRLTAMDALKGHWQTHFAKSKGEWLVPILRRMAAGENVSAEEPVAAYKTIHGQEPASYEVNT